MSVERKKDFIINVAFFALILILFALFLQYLFTPLLPIIIGLTLSVLLQGPVNKVVEKTKIPKGVVSTFFVLLVLAIFVVFIIFVGVKVFGELKGLLQFVFSKVSDYSWVEEKVFGIINTLPEVLKNLLLPEVEGILAGYKSILTKDATDSLAGFDISKFDFSLITSRVPGVLETAKQIPSFLIATIITVIFSCFATAEYDIFAKFIRTHVKGGDNNIFSVTKRIVMTSIWKLMKAYFFICCITFSEMLIGLTIFRVLGIFESKYTIAIALVIAVFDIMPVAGTGGIVLPWAFYNLFFGNPALGFGLVLLYIVITIVRQIVEPRFIAGEMSLPPALTLAVMYTGLKFYGMVGMFTFMIAVYCVKLLSAEGIIDFFPVKEEEKLQNVIEKT
ncbi:MAG: AI-2E family transporter [Ruminococcaceae bacterium]|nr:AI-2E family transporter [Oscillospiraceae bacterium]